jgi:hypothetical protein
MAVNIDTVYQRVLGISNKEKRGYITPLEYNLFANQAQLDIFNQYFYDLNQFARIPSTQDEYASSVDLIKEKMSIFELFKQATTASSNNTFTLNTALYKLGDVYSTVSGTDFLVERLTKKELIKYQASPLAKPTATRPVYIDKTDSGDKIEVYPSTITSGITYNYIKKPANVSWTGTVVNDISLYNSSTSTNFELHESEETNLVIKILALAGILLEDPQLYQVSSQEEIKKVQQEKA